MAYYHIELDTHELIVANDTLAETYLDEVPRSHFDNWMEWVELNRKTMTCEPLPFLRAKSRRQLPASIRARIDERATSLESKRTF